MCTWPAPGLCTLFLMFNPVPASAGAPDDESPVQLEHVRVTESATPARDRETAPSSVVLDGAVFEAAGYRSLQDLQALVPGLGVYSPNPRLSSFSIRGLSSSAANDGLEGSVGLFVDGVYLGRQGMGSFEVFDLDRIEVLRGPQSVSAGVSSTAGAIHLYTRAPAPQFEAAIEAGVGSQDLRSARGVLGGRLNAEGTLSARLSGFATLRDGSIDNLSDDRSFVDRNRQGLRAQLLFEPRAGLRNLLSAELGRVREDCCVFQLTTYRPLISARDRYMLYTREPTDPFARQVQSDSRIALEQDQRALTNTLRLSLSDGWILHSLSAYRSWDFLPYNDDGTALRLVPRVGTVNEHEQLSQEFRLEREHAASRFTAGLLLMAQDLDTIDHFEIGEDLLPWSLGGAMRRVSGQDLDRTNADFGLAALGRLVDGIDSRTDVDQRSRSYALFGRFDQPLAPGWESGLGLRYGHDAKRARIVRERVLPDPDREAALDQLALLDDGFFAALGRTNPGTLTPNRLLDQVVGPSSSRRSRYEDSSWAGEYSLRHAFTPVLQGYALIARGVKPGGVNLAPVGATVQPSFDPETANNHELGLKMRGRNLRLTGSAAVFHTEVRDYQALTFENQPAVLLNPRQVNVINVREVRLQGAELDGRMVLPQGLSLRAGLAYTRAITVDFPDAPDENSNTNTKDLSGEPLYNAPRWTTTAGADWQFPIQAGWSGALGLDHSYRSETYGSVERGRGSRIEGYSLVDLRMDLFESQHQLTLSAAVRNLFDREHLLAIGSLYGVGNYGATVGEERQFELRLRKAFN